MKGDFSRFTFDPTKHYTQVLLQQGRVQLDADWNEQQAIAQYRAEAIAQDVIGVTGVPKVNGGFQIGLTADGRDLTLSPGHYYVDGILCELEVPTTYSSQPDFAAPLPTASGRYVVYLDVWQQHISAIEDPQIRETALGGVDTATRSQIVWQVKLDRLGNVGTGTCADWQPPAASSGKLTASVDQSDATPQPCILPPASGYRGLENQCYRVEVHDGGSADAAGTRFKWSRDNGAVMTAIEKVSAQTVTVRDLGQDDSRSFRRDQWVEVLFDRLERIDRRGTLTQINADIQPERRELTLAAVPAGLEKQAGESEENYRDRLQSRGYHARLRRWDGTGAITTAEIDLEQGIKIRFSPGTYQAGDYWMIPARTATSATTGDIEWPRQADNSPIAKLPDGIRHHYSPIATVDFDGTVFQTVVDYRRFFPALSAIAAEDVSFTNDTCGTEFNTAKTVKDAIGLLCRSQIGACTFVLSPSNWQTLLPQIAAASPDAHICLQVGTYTLDRPIAISNKGHLKISGGGVGTRLIAATSEAALIFTNCQSVTVRDLFAESGESTAANTNQLVNGTLSFFDCASVTVESVRLKCGTSPTRSQSCITVAPSVQVSVTANRKTKTSSGRTSSVRIHHCDLEIGHQQVGILLVNAVRAQVEDNLLQTPSQIDFRPLLQDQRFRSAIRRSLISNIQFGTPTDTIKRRQGINAAVTLAGQSIYFKTDATLASTTDENEWTRLLNLSSTTIRTPQELQNRIVKLADRLLLNQGVLNDVQQPKIAAWIASVQRQFKAVAAQGIVVAGTSAKEIRIANNTIQNVLQGIHVGVSHRESFKGAIDSAETISILNNSIGVTLPPIWLRERHGIFVGNCRSLLIENNTLTIERFDKTASLAIEGIRAFGYFGTRLIIRQNQLVSVNQFNNFSIGIYVNPLNSFKQPQWIVRDNLISNSPNARVKILPEAVKPLFKIEENY